MSCSKDITNQKTFKIRNEYDIVSINNTEYHFFNPYKNRGKLQLKGSIHNHTDNSRNVDGHGSGDPYLTACKFRDEGNFDFYTYTDHNFVTENPNVDGIVWIGNSVEDTRFDQHLCVYNLPDDYKYYDISGSCQEIINYYSNLGTCVSYAHPNWRPIYQSNDKIQSVNNIQFVEILNSGDGGSERAFAIMQNHDSFVFGVGVDDYHYSEDWSDPNQYFNKAYIYAYAQDKSKDSIWASLLSGSFYASNGATMDIECVDLNIVIKTSKPSKIEIIIPDNDNIEKYRIVNEYDNRTNLCYRIDGTLSIFWIKVINEDGIAISQAFKIFNE